ncbi:uncharacterized protein [Eucyclogobius newberryi]|uniref:uncharacterized protein n=1 Tax=Eucyclogobius newberryi TaxID=166745 RepID=UPI003B5C67CB
MCKVESSTDSEREISPRWSDTSTVGCGTSAAESDGVLQTLPLRPTSTGRHGCCSVFLDPYDGSSEDSDVSMDVQWNRRIRQAAKSTICWCVARNRRFNQQPHHRPAQEPIKTTSMEKGKNTDSYDENSNFHRAMSFSDKGHSQALDIGQSELDSGGPRLTSGWSSMMDRSPSPSNLHKRKFGVPGAELVDQAPRKRRCVVDMELEEDTTLTY